MKKIFSKLLILAIVSVILLILIYFFSINFNNIVVSAEDIVEGIGDIDNESVTAGYEALGRIIGGGLSVLAVATIMIYVCIIFGTMFCAIIILQIVARLVQIGNEKKWKNITSEVCTYMSIVIYIILCLLFLAFLIINIFSYKILFAVALNIYCVVAFIRILLGKNMFSISKKIHENKYL